LQIIDMSYLGTQFFYWNNLDPMPVDPFALYEKMTNDERAKTEALTLLFPKDLNLFLTQLSRFIVAFLGQQLTDKSSVLSARDFEGAILLSTGFGAILWQQAEAMWIGRPTAHRSPVRIFLSYSRKDKRQVQVFRRIFEKFGYDVWIDEKDIIVGEPLLDTISKAISGSADFVVLFLSDNSTTSEWVKLETRLAYERELKLGYPFLLPVRLGNCKIPTHLSIKKYADAFGRITRCAKELQNAVSNLIAKRPYF
jgi:hypothetical protein